MPALSVAENLDARRSAGAPSRPARVVDRRAHARGGPRACWRSSTSRPIPTRRVDRLSFAERQLVAIAKALRRRCRLLRSSTSRPRRWRTREIERLFAVLARMKSQGTAIIYVSHRLDEVVALADRCTVLRDGRVAAVSRRGAFAVAIWCRP